MEGAALPSTMLPLSSFIAFKAYRFAKPLIIWRGAGMSTRLLRSLAFTTATSKKTEDKGTILLAERYGGKGVGKNGGGARAGNFGQFQLKGVGPNNLVGRSSDFWHSHGSMTLAEALFECMWSEICNDVLPYGSVRTLGIIEKPSWSPVSNNGQLTIAPGALLVREQAIRPAHFMRADHFDPSSDDLYFSDAARTGAALAAFISIGGRSYKLQGTDTSTQSTGLLSCLAQRFAAQIAAARARRIPHGSLNCSNIALDGRYIDFGTMTTLPNHRPFIVSAGNPHIWEDESFLFQTFRDLTFYVNRYLFGGSRIVDAGALLLEFKQYISLAVEEEFLLLTGFPPLALSRADPVHKTALWRSMTELLLLGFGMAEYFRPADCGRSRTDDLSSVLTLAATQDSLSGLKANVEPIISNQRVAKEFVKAYWGLRQSIYAGSTGSQALQLFTRVNAARLNSDLVILRRHHPKSWLHRLDSAPWSERLAYAINAGQFMLRKADEIAFTIDGFYYVVSPVQVQKLEKKPTMPVLKLRHFCEFAGLNNIAELTRMICEPPKSQSAA